ncbi:stalk domain-containing protein [Caldalkalibacillus mannanilyticus]|uniref:stalk domain-containing protein n=1 Tax=Caldalkalibacillus mannanilyticus TaxID=1418 RepID=UPI00046A3717|nr:stalk domain-containing protein [Caldalkalibacillus mannanilyticus]
MKKSVRLIIILFLVFSMFSSMVQATTSLSDKYWVGYEYDYEKGGTLYRVDKIANTKEVIVNDMMTTFKVQGDWVYYMYIDGYEGHTFAMQVGQMYRVKIDGTGREKLSGNDLITSFDISKNHIFYGVAGSIKQDGTQMINPGKMIKMNLDGSNKTTISEDSIKSIIIHGDTVYYINSTDNDRIYKMDSNGKNKKKLTDGMVFYDTLWSIKDGWIIFYAGDLEANYSSYMMKLDGSGEFNLKGTANFNGHAFVVKITTEWIYYSAYDNSSEVYVLYKIKTNGQNATKIDDLSKDKMLNVASTYIEYTNVKGETKKIPLSEEKTPTTQPKVTSSIKVTFNGDEVTFDTEPMIRNGRTLLPMRAVFELLGADVKWDPKLSLITATTEDTSIELVIGSRTATVNGKKVELDQPPIINNSRTLVPIRFVAETLNAEINWDSKTSTITITK